MSDVDRHALLELALAATCVARRPSPDGLLSERQRQLRAAITGAVDILDERRDPQIPRSSPLALVAAAIDHALAEGVELREIIALLSRWRLGAGDMEAA